MPVYPDGLPPEQRDRKSASDVRKLSIPVHHLESICVFGPSTISPPALDLCWEHGVAVNFEICDYVWREPQVPARTRGFHAPQEPQ